MSSIRVPAPGTVHVHVASCSDLDDARAQVQALAWLTADEHARHDAFVFAHSRREFLATRVLGRGVLGALAGQAPPALRFVPNAYGRPAMSPPASFDFNLTNTHELVACAVGFGFVGVDAEPIERQDAVLEVAHMVFTPSERAGLVASPELAVDLWVLKEAFMKATGYGMSLPPHTFELSQAKDGRWGVALHSPPSGLALPDPTRVSFSVCTVFGHRVATCSTAPAAVELLRQDLRSLLGVAG